MTDRTGVGVVYIFTLDGRPDKHEGFISVPVKVYKFGELEVARYIKDCCGLNPDKVEIVEIKK